MNEVMQAILNRRSIRRYRLEPVSTEQLNLILKAGQAAASAMNQQPWYFAAVQRPELIEQLGRLMGEEGNDPYYHAPLLIIGFGRREAYSPVIDTSLALSNMMLAAQSLGLGSCWIDYTREVFSRSEFSGLAGALGVPAGYFCVGSLVIGVPDEQPEAHPVNPQTVSVIQ